MLKKKTFFLNYTSTYSIFYLIHNIYGIKYSVWLYYSHLFESLQLISGEEKIKFLLKSFNFLVPNFNYLSELYIYHLLLLIHMRLYRGYRMLFGYPARGQRTWSNANTAKRQNILLLHLKTQQFNTYTLHNYSNTEVLSEYINFLWYTQWNVEWRSMARNISRHRFFKKTPKKFLKFDDIINFRIEHFAKEVLLLKKFKNHRKKRKTNYNNITGGFKFGFVLYYRKLL